MIQKLDPVIEKWRNEKLAEHYEYLISDANKGLRNSLEKEFAGVPHQRCRVHFMRNLQSLVPRKEKKALIKSIKQIFNAPNREMAIQTMR